MYTTGFHVDAFIYSNPVCIWTVGLTEQINVEDRLFSGKLLVVSTPGSQAACEADPLVINERNLTGIQVMDGIA